MIYSGMIQGPGGGGSGGITFDTDWRLLTSLHGATLQDGSTLNGGASGFSAGTFTFNFINTTTVVDGYRDNTIRYNIPLGGDGNLLEGFNTDQYALEIYAQTTRSTTQNNGLAFALLDSNTVGSANGVGVHLTRSGSSLFIGTQASTSAVTQTASTAADLNLLIRFVVIDDLPYGTIRMSNTSGTFTTAGNYIVDAGETLTGSNRFLSIQGLRISGGTAAADTVTAKVWVRQVPIGDPL